MVVHNITNEGTLTGSSFSYEYASWWVAAQSTILHRSRIELVYF
jgi:hypothetical protein